MLKLNDFKNIENVLYYKFTRKDHEKKEYEIRIVNNGAGQYSLSIFKEGTRIEQIEKPEYQNIGNVLKDANKMFNLYE